MAEWDFHWLRPLWLSALLPTALIFWLLWRRAASQGNWQSIIAPELLAPLTDKLPGKASRLPLAALGLAWLVAIIALAGPAFDRLPQPVYQKEDALVILLDLSPSMYAQDNKPNRLTQAKREIQDILKHRREGMTALIAYAGDAHVVTPLTDDTKTIQLLLASLSPGMMPVMGNQPIAALELAAQLLSQSPVENPRVLFITDEIPAADFSGLGNLLDKHQLQLSILGIGTAAGAPIPVANGGFLKNRNREVVVSRLNNKELASFAKKQGGRYRTSHYSEDDIEYLLKPAANTLDSADAVEVDSRSFDSWRDSGPWLALVLLPVGLLAFRRGWMLGIGLALLLPSHESIALDWQSLWQTPDQQGQQALRDGDAEKAAELFDDTQWRGSAWYRAQQYDRALEYFSQQQDADGLYNTANALAHKGRIEDAIAAYDRALSLDPGHEDAAFNKQLLEKMQKKQQQNQDNQQNQDQGEGQQGQQGSQDKQQAQNQDGDAGEDNPQQGQDQNEQQEQQQDQQGQGQQEQSDQAQQQAAGEGGDQTPPDPELEQWLRQIPDDPGELLKRKFEYQSRARQGNYSKEERY